MKVKTTAGTEVDSELVYKYFRNLVNQFFKILPMREDNEESLPTYIESLRAELLGCGNVIEPLTENPSFITLISILQYLMDNPDCPVAVTKREVFKAISICNKFRDQYATPKGGG